MKLLLNAEGLKAAAQLSGIYTCSYTDKSSIPSEDLGYAALAQGIGMVPGRLGRETRTATRAEGAVMLHKAAGVVSCPARSPGTEIESAKIPLFSQEKRNFYGKCGGIFSLSSVQTPGNMIRWLPVRADAF